MRSIDDILKNWGKAQRKPSSRSEILKSEILSKLPAGASVIEKPARRIPWLSLAFSAMAVLAFFINSVDLTDVAQRNLSAPTSLGIMPGGSGMVSENSMPQMKDSFYNPSAPITDTREFLKQDYNAEVRTRKVDMLASRIQTMVRGYGGRIDGYSASEKHGYVSFAIPAAKLEAFRTEMKSTIRAKLYTEYISSQNLLPQKQSIEEQDLLAEKALADLRVQRDQLIADHKKTLSSLQGQLNAVNKELADSNTDETRQQQLNAQKNTLQNRIYNENKSYTASLASFDSQIANWESNLEGIKKQDQNLQGNVATVQGYITLNWISLWELADLYLPGPALAWLFLAAGIAAYARRRQRAQFFLP